MLSGRSFEAEGWHGLCTLDEGASCGSVARVAQRVSVAHRWDGPPLCAISGEAGATGGNVVWGGLARVDYGARPYRMRAKRGRGESYGTAY
jgi:hypothetical protein